MDLASVTTSLERLALELRSSMPAEIGLAVTSNPCEADLTASEATAIVGWTVQRRLQFAGGRSCARRALDAIGTRSTSILFDGEGLPVWPPGSVGGISHKRQHCIAIAASHERYTSLGIDLERNRSDRSEEVLLSEICPGEGERAQANLLRGVVESPATLILSAKEAFYKFQFPLTRARLRWEQIEVAFREGTFLAKCDADRPIAVTGLYRVTSDWIAALVFQKRTVLKKYV